MPNPAPGFTTHPNHTVEIHPCDNDIKIEISNALIAKFNGALVLHEGQYEPVFYFQKTALPDAMLQQSAHTTYCPFKGEASYYHLIHDGKKYENAVWYYPTPFDEALAIKDYIAIYPNMAKVTLINE